MAQTNNHRRRRKLKAEINVVPYIDVMLVLLIIFMVTAPLLNLGVDIDLPEANAKALVTDTDPVLVSIGADGSLYLTLGEQGREKIDSAMLVNKVSAFVRQNPKVPVVVGADAALNYGTVIRVMGELQSAGVPKVSLMSQPIAVKKK
ncbi:MAG: protein TolR [Lysobacterales bacterium CG02_land_8_20_14_3_00_62_12]|nr:MAG: protein TolR [Xanthomonadales bacterium CG02_land_8_20_14_3_00_62_12]PJA42523.1 MAG: protein TolR [Xanthomonadales bacterium CG_4_9_14_3_um_filter_62_6]